MTETVTSNPLGMTDVQLTTARLGAGGIEVVQPGSATELALQMTSCGVVLEIIAGAPGPAGPAGEGGATDPGDLTVYFENSLV